MISSRRTIVLAIVAGGAAGCAAPPVLTDSEKLDRLTVMTEDVAKRFPDVEQLSVADVGRLLEKDSIVLVDVRETREREVSGIPGAITAEEFERDPAAWADVAVVAYCTIGHRSSEYAQRLTAGGHAVANLSGSILAWAHDGGPLVGPGGPTRLIHVFGSDWDLAPSTYQTTW